MELQNLELPDYYAWNIPKRDDLGREITSKVGIGLYNTKTKAFRRLRQLPTFITRHDVKIKMRYGQNIPHAQYDGVETVLGIWIKKSKPKRY